MKIGSGNIGAIVTMNKRKIQSVLIFPCPNGVRIEITRQAGLFDISSGKLVRYYHANSNNIWKLRRLVKHAAVLNYLMFMRIAENYD